MGVGRRACSLIVVLALLLGPSVGRWRPGDCTRCAPTCPMHKKRLGCHHGSRPSAPRCHAAGGPSVVASGCAPTEGAATAPPWRAIVAPRTAARPFLASQRIDPPAVHASTRPFPQPPSEPPRALA
jgi:hypothetical protein